MSASILFISDLHLDATRPASTEALLALLHGEAREAQALYILGDLFEAWIGDDDRNEPGEAVIAALRELVDSGVPVFVMRGNRDFLFGREFAARSGATLLPDPCVVELHGVPTLLMHGDLLCTEDTAYQAFRAQVRDPKWQEQFLAQPLAARREFAAKARAASQAHQQGRAESIGDVTPSVVIETMQRFGVTRMIHGHTHRPAIHQLWLDQTSATRIVLGDWYDQASLLRLTPEGVELTGAHGPASGAN